MKFKFFITTALLLSFSLGTFAQEIIELPLTLKKGFGVFHVNFASYSPEAESSPFREELKGIPSNLKKVTRHHITLQGKQQYYQSYIQNKISEDYFGQLKQYFNFEPNEEEFSKEPLRVSVYIIKGEDEKGNSVWLADTDTDLDFSDEKPRPLLTYTAPYDISKYKELAENAVHVKSQQVVNGKVVEVNYPVAFVMAPEGNSAYVSFPSLQTALFKVNNEAYELQFSPANFLHYNAAEAAVTTMTVVANTNEGDGKSLALDEELSPSGYFELGRDVYQYLGVDHSNQVVRLKKVKEGSSLRAAQVGFTTLFFQGMDLESGREVSIDQLRGKYVLLDFWFTTCAPCIKEFPKLKALMAQYDRDKFEVVGIVAHSKPDQVTKAIQKYGLTWKQILSDEIVKQHGVSSFPYTILVSPEGKVIHKNLRGEELEEVLAELIK